MQYPVDDLTAAERARLAPHVTHPERPVFGLVNLPETVKGALFARYSRYPGTLRRLFLDEFADSLPEAAVGAAWDSGEGDRARELYDRIFLGFGDDSVAQLGGLHVAAEWCSNVLTKVLQRPRIGAYLEQSTRYIAYDKPVAGLGDAAAGRPGYRYYRDDELAAAAPGYAPAMDELFAIYGRLLPQVTAWCGDRYPAPEGTSPAAHQRALRAKALDLLRGLLPASTLSHVGIYASGQTYEQLILHLLAHPLPEARRYGRWILDAVQAVTPSFVSRVDRPDRGGRWVEYLREREAAADRWAGRLGLDQATATAGEQHSSVRLVHVDGGEDDLLAGLLYESAGGDESTLLDAVRALSGEERSALLGDLVGARENRRHRPGRGFERVRYRFEVVSDYGAFRDLQRHRMLTVQWQRLTPELGAGVPDEVEQAGAGDDYRRALERSAQAWQALVDAGRPREASYAVCLGYRMRYALDLNARAAMQLIELRSGREGHPSYRAVAHEMHRLIGQVHPAVAGAMRHVDSTVEPRLERILSEMRADARHA
ncbi:Thymidylate synthase thyX [Patulibacter medicamentivorans]|uniref:Thymidylate synthase thyX n=1 Tax=Patulibacter medicamentivorans TaxID=1097667 RepID=H0E2A0_9ACTN|nr:FAD-dependent thymidylate synthase [Patulibacter medicamentivorans]EHN12171.1 Thymidylate synthase thyX [Patulibacter medicamentivorans]